MSKYEELNDYERGWYHAIMHLAAENIWNYREISSEEWEALTAHFVRMVEAKAPLKVVQARKELAESFEED